MKRWEQSVSKFTVRWIANNRSFTSIWLDLLSMIFAKSFLQIIFTNLKGKMESNLDNMK